MNPEVKKSWKAALTSGEYVQGIGQLKSPDDKFCCLGVLCDLYMKATGKGKWTNRGGGTGTTFFDSETGLSSGFPTDEVSRWAGLPNNSPEVDGFSLHTMNDTGIPFDKIAEQIDKL